MSLRDLSVGQMAQVSKGWLESKEQRPIILNQPKLKPWLSDMEVVHAEVMKQEVLRSGVNTALAKVMAAQEVGDQVHDRRLGGIWTVLEGLEMLAPELKVPAGAFTALRMELFPGGLSMTQRSYADEAAEAESAPKRLTPPSKALLNTAIGPMKLSAVVDTWLASAQDLDGLERERNRLVGQTQAHKATGSLRAARTAWIKVAHALMNNIESLSDEELPPDKRATLLATFRRYDEMATRGAGGPAGGGGDDHGGDGADGHAASAGVPAPAPAHATAAAAAPSPTASPAAPAPKTAAAAPTDPSDDDASH